MSRLASTRWIKSRETLTTISSPVPPKNCVTVNGTFRLLPTTMGSTAMKARKAAPTYVMRSMTLSRYSAVRGPGLKPGMNDPWSRSCLLISSGLNCTVIQK